MRRYGQAPGYFEATPLVGAHREWDALQCPHCEAVLRIIRGQAEGAWCGRCGGPVCDRPPCNTACRPYQQFVERQLWLIHRKLERQAHEERLMEILRGRKQ